MSGVGAYVRRKDRRYVLPEPPDGRPRCGSCHALLRRLPHVCKEATFESAMPTLRFEPFPDAAGEMLLHNMLNPEPEPGPPYVWLATGDDDGNPVLRLLNPGPASSSLPDDPYRQEAVQDEPTRCWSGP